MNNTISSCLLVSVIMAVIVMGIMAIIYRIPFLKRHILGDEI